MPNSEMRVLLTGGSGRLGQELRRVRPELQAPPRAVMDITDAAAVRAAVAALRPTHVLHAAAFTDVRLAELDALACERVNVEGTAHLLDALAQEGLNDCRVLYVSSACVFAGDAGPYVEDSEARPCNAYGRSKLRAEALVRNWPRHLVVRTNFVARGPWPFPAAFTDRYGTYLYADQVAQGLLRLLDDPIDGVVHLAGRERLSMFELARLNSPEIKPMTMADLSTALPLTRDMSLASRRWPLQALGQTPS